MARMRELRNFLELGFSAADLEKIRDALLALPELREHFPRSGGASPDDIACIHNRGVRGLSGGLRRVVIAQR